MHTFSKHYRPYSTESSEPYVYDIGHLQRRRVGGSEIDEFVKLFTVEAMDANYALQRAMRAVHYLNGGTASGSLPHDVKPT